jgi:EthD domain
MEKVLYLLAADEGTSGDRLREQLVDDLAPRLLTVGAHRVQVNVMDSGVEAAAGTRMHSGSGPCPDAVISVWVDSANAPLRASYDEMLREVDVDVVAYLVTESAPLPGEPADGRRPGYTQVSFLQRPERLDEQSWLEHWHDHHTQVAIDTQATSRYIQNRVVRPLTPGAPPCAAVVEETFPEEAMTDQSVFFDAVGDDGRRQSNAETLMASVQAFLDFDLIDVVPTSEYSVLPA